jgi:PAS domain S-box-containing protein
MGLDDWLPQGCAEGSRRGCVELDPIVVQAAFAVPLALGFSVYTWARRDRTQLHRLAAILVASLACWMIALLLRRVSDARAVGEVALFLEFLTGSANAPLFVVMMGRFARHPSFEHSRAATIGLSVVFALFFASFLTNDWHGLLIRDRASALAGLHPATWAGPLFWGYQGWIMVADALGIALCGWAAWRGRTPDERRRPLLVLVAVALPVVAHVLYITKALPIQYTLSPAAAGMAVVLFAAGIHRHGLLESQPIVRQDLIEHIPDGLVLADQRGVVLDANAAAEATLGCTREALRGAGLEAIFAALGVGDTGRLLAARIAALPPGGRHVEGELRTPDGRSIEMVAGAVGATGYHPAGRFVSLTDRSAERRSERLLRERQKLESVGILAAGVAHEVNNPLAFVRSNLAHVRGQLDRLLECAKVDAGGKDADLLELPYVFDESLEGVDRIAQIVEDMLRFSRIPEEGAEAVDINDVVRGALRLAALDRNHAVTAREQLADGLPRVMGSPNRLVQVLLNLLLNANQALAGRADALVEAETEWDGSHVVVRVRDNGPGIPEEQIERVFDPFFTTRDPSQGTGLGLSIAFDIVREHGGKLEVESAPGRGACFTMRLPAAAA